MLQVARRKPSRTHRTLRVVHGTAMVTLYLRRSAMMFSIVCRRAGGIAVPVTYLDKKKQEIAHAWPYFLPDGRHFLFYARGRASGVNTRLYVGSLDSKEANPI